MLWAAIANTVAAYLVAVRSIGGVRCTAFVFEDIHLHQKACSFTGVFLQMAGLYTFSNGKVGREFIS